MGILHSRDESTKEPTKKVRRTHDADSSAKRSAAGALEDNYAVDPKVLGRPMGLVPYLVRQAVTLVKPVFQLRFVAAGCRSPAKW